jgi:hypothetical protein
VGFWPGVSFANFSVPGASKSVFVFLGEGVFPLGVFAEIWHKSAFYIPGRNSTFGEV